MNPISITEISVRLIKLDQGLCGFASCVVNNQLFLGNIALHETFDKTDIRLVFPTKPLRNGKQLPSFYPINKETEQALTKAIVNAYRNLFDNPKPPHESQETFL